MRRLAANRRPVLFALCVGVFSFLVYTRDLAGVPFHPDEASWLYMSAESDALFRGDPARLVWRADGPLDPDTTLRMLNAPVPKYVLRTAVRWGSGDASTALWDFSESFGQNAARGAVPNADVLLAARCASALMAAVSFALFFLALWWVAGKWAALIGTALLATHPLELLHLRRAMAEGTAQACSVGAFVAILWLARTTNTWSWVRRVMIAGIALGVAVASKQSAAPLVIVALALTLLSARRLAASAPVRAVLARRMLLALGAVAGITFYTLNPVMYVHPLLSSAVMVGVRFRLAAGDAERARPTPTLASRVRATVSETLIRPPAFEEVPFYVQDIQPQRDRYRSAALYRLWDRPSVRLLFAAAVGIGIVFAIAQVVRDRLTAATTLPLIAAGVWLMAQTTFGLLFYPMDWQRYFVPLLPPLCVFAAIGCVRTARAASGSFTVKASPRASGLVHDDPQ